MKSTYKGTVSELIVDTPLVKTIRFDLGGQPFSFKAGQYVILGVDLSASPRFKVLYGKDSFQERPFSISSNPVQKDSLDVTVVNTDNGFMTDYFLNYLTRGTEVDIYGPFGNFYLDESRKNQHIVLLGAGSGVMPLISMASYIKDKGLKRQVHMIFSFQNKDKIIFNKVLQELDQSPNISSNVTLTRDVWEGSIGRIDQEMIMKSGFPLTHTDFYLCGPTQFKKDMEAILINRCGASKYQIFQ